MHHSEIGKIIEVIEDFFLPVDSFVPTVISPMLPDTEDCFNKGYGIRIITQWAKSKVEMEINSANRDSNNVEMHFYQVATNEESTLSLCCAATKYDEYSIRFFLKTIMQISKGKLKVEDVDSYYLERTNLEEIM
jgi:hypothetical protein